MSSSNATTGAAAYRRSLSSKQLEAEVFSHVSRGLRAVEGETDRIRAIADARRLWSIVRDLVQDPDNALPVPLRAQISGIALAVLRECDAAEPDVDFVAEVNDQFAAGLWH